MTPPRLRWVEFATSRLLSPGGLLVSQVGIDARDRAAYAISINAPSSTFYVVELLRSTSSPTKVRDPADGRRLAERLAELANFLALPSPPHHGEQVFDLGDGFGSLCHGHRVPGVAVPMLSRWLFERFVVFRKPPT